MADASTQTTASTDAASQTVVYKQENVSIGFATFDAASQTDVTIGFATFDNASQTGERRNGQFCRSRSPPPARDAPPPAAPAALPALPRVAEMWQVEEQAARRRWLAKNTTVDPVTGAVFEGSSEALFASAGGSGSTVLETPLARGATVGDRVRRQLTSDSDRRSSAATPQAATDDTSSHSWSTAAMRLPAFVVPPVCNHHGYYSSTPVTGAVIGKREKERRECALQEASDGEREQLEQLMGSSETLFASAGGSGSDHHHTILRQQIEYEL
jgi:hypothetical protein